MITAIVPGPAIIGMAMGKKRNPHDLDGPTGLYWERGFVGQKHLITDDRNHEAAGDSQRPVGNAEKANKRLPANKLTNMMMPA